MSSVLLTKTPATLLQRKIGRHLLFHNRPSSLTLAAAAAASAASSPTLQHRQGGGGRCRYFSSNEHSQATTTTSSSQQQQEQPSEVFLVYTHHVSKIVLQHLQDVRAGWLVEQGLDRGLQIKSNGTFLLHFPPSTTTTTGGAGGPGDEPSRDGGKIWYVYLFVNPTVPLLYLGLQYLLGWIIFLLDGLF